MTYPGHCSIHGFFEDDCAECKAEDAHEAVKRGLPTLGAGARMRLRCRRCGYTSDHVVGEPLPACPGACGATANSPAIER